MSDSQNMPAIAGEVFWRNPDKEKPPRGVKLLALTSGGVTVITDWVTNSNLVAWSPMPKKRAQVGQDRAQ
jgi:hypothetical protein